MGGHREEGEALAVIVIAVIAVAVEVITVADEEVMHPVFVHFVEVGDMLPPTHKQREFPSGFHFFAEFGGDGTVIGKDAVNLMSGGSEFLRKGMDDIGETAGLAEGIPFAGDECDSHRMAP